MNYHPCPKREAPDAACRMLRPALHYASHGWPIFPCKPDKRPATGHGFKDATCERKTIIAWWTANPAAMIGMPTGAVSKIIAVDLDRDAAKGLDGVTAFAALVNSAGASIRTRKHRTPRGGVHLLFAHHGEAVKNSASAIAPGVDTRGSGGYIVLPPSRTETGEYRVEDDADPTPLPPWLCDLLRERKVMG
ncbi:MAG: bifunctional DNA primase/polymerase, partial [Verrucomicrobia bacterium]|nr:bifunctional DNA primase/polymerase [Verrucomicrobiota bacterium]